MPRKKIEIEQGTMSYLKIGHDGYEKGEYDSENPNYIWVTIGGRFEARKESKDCTGHHTVKKWEVPRQFNGRYDGKKKIISCVPRDMSTFREIPDTLISQLQQKFPKAKKIIIC